MAISLDSIVKGKRNKPPRIVVYGMGGLGKTTFAGEAPNPICIPTEAGQDEVGMDRVVDGVVQSWDEILNWVDFFISEDHGYKTLVIDSLDAAEPMLWRHVCDHVLDDKGKKVSNIEDFGYYKGQRTHAPKYMAELLAGLDVLRDKRNMGIVLIAHHRVKKVEPPDSTAYEQYQIKLDDGVASLTFDWADAVLFMHQKVHVKTEGKGFDERTRALGTGERILYAQERPAWRAKNRYGLPLEISIPQGASWDAFQAALDTVRASTARPSTPQLATVS